MAYRPSWATANRRPRAVARLCDCPPVARTAECREPFGVDAIAATGNPATD